MSKKNWSQLNHLQVGQYAEYFAKMIFTRYGFDVYTSEVDDKGIDFIVKSDGGNFYEMQVKSIRTEKSSYVFQSKDKFDITNKRLFLVLVLFTDMDEPHIYLLNSQNWLVENELFRNREYKSRGLKSKDEWGLNITKRTIGILNNYRFEENIHLLQ